MEKVIINTWFSFWIETIFPLPLCYFARNLHYWPTLNGLSFIFISFIFMVIEIFFGNSEQLTGLQHSSLQDDSNTWANIYDILLLRNSVSRRLQVLSNELVSAFPNSLSLKLRIANLLQCRHLYVILNVCHIVRFLLS